MTRVDVHQHLWTEPLLAALSARSSAPRARWQRGGWTLELAGEPDSVLPAESVEERADAVRAARFDRALIALSSALGVEGLAPEAAEPLLAAHAAIGPAPTALGIWASISLADSAEAIGQRLPAALERADGLCLPAAALATPAAVERLAPVLVRLEASGKPLFVHPGPAAAPIGAPLWWPALADYLAQLQAAWLAFAHAGRPAHPRLRVLFAALAGLAPLHAERIAARGGPVAAAHDRLVFYDTSSYGPTAIAAMAAAVGRGQLVYGSDRPVIEPSVEGGPLDDRALTVDNPARLLTPDPEDR
jgi:hypothetical protein